MTLQPFCFVTLQHLNCPKALLNIISGLLIASRVHDPIATALLLCNIAALLCGVHFSSYACTLQNTDWQNRSQNETIHSSVRCEVTASAC